MNHEAHSRKLTVGYMPGTGKNHPMIRLQGKWLEELGFKIGDRVEVTLSENRIVITKTESTISTSQLTLNLMI